MCLLLSAQQTQAQYAYGASGIGYDPNTKVVYGYSRTSVDYWAGTYYDPYVEGYLYDPYYLRDWGYARGYESYYPAVVETAAYSTPLTRYDVISDHYVISWYSVSVTICDYYGFYGGCGYDPYGFSNFWGGWYGGFNYFYGGYGGYVPERTYYLGSTGISGITPPPDDCDGSTATSGDAMMASSSGTSEYDGTSATSRDTVQFATGSSCTEPPWKVRIYSTNNSEYIEGTTPQKAMLGATIPLRADIVGANSTSGVYEWSIDNSAKGGNSNTLSEAITTLGSHTVSVSYTLNSVKRSASVTVNVIVPQLATFSVDGKTVFTSQFGGPAVGQGSQCLSFYDPSYHMYTACTYSGVAGNEIDAAVEDPGKVISNKAESKLKFLQIVNTYTKRVKTTTGECQELTKRPSKDDTSTGWMLDDSDPYGLNSPRPGVGKVFEYNSRGVNVSMDDSPDTPLEDGYNYTIDDRFKVYLVYYTGSDTQPQNEKAIGLLEWSYGGQTTYNAANNSHQEVPGTLFPTEDPPNGKKLTPSNDGTGIGTYDRTRVQDYVKPPYPWKSCGGTTTPGTRNGVSFLSQSVPTAMEAGQTYNVSVTLRNSGDTTWTSDVYKLGSQNPQDNTTWGTNRIYLPSGVTVPPGSDYTFNFYVTAPSVGGLYNFQWRMLKEGVEWFGDLSTNVTIDVTSPDSCDWSIEQSCYANGGDWDYSTCQCHYYPDPCGGGEYNKVMMPCGYNY